MKLNQALNMAAPIGRSFLEKYNGINSDIIIALEKNFPEAVAQTKDIAPKFLGKTNIDTIFNLWAFLRTKLIYKKDPYGVQQIRLPNRFIHDASEGKGGDCKSYSLFSAAILYNLGFDVYFVYVAYTLDKINDKISSHVFVRAKKNNENYILDGCNRKFNTFTGKLIIENQMRIETLSGLPVNRRKANVLSTKTPSMFIEQKARDLLKHELETRSQMSEIEEFIGKKEKRKGKGKGFLKKAFQGFKKINLAPQRGSFLALIRLNARGLAYKFAIAYKDTQAKQKVDDWWKKLGGDPNKFWTNVKKGAKKKPLLGTKIKKTQISNDIGSAIAVGALLVSAGTILAAAKPVFNAIKGIFKKKNPKLASEFDEAGGAGGEAGLEKDIIEAGGDVTPPPVGAEIEQNPQLDTTGKSGFKLSTPVILGAIGLAGAAFFFMSSKRK
jgi:hypothetical protein